MQSHSVCCGLIAFDWASSIMFFILQCIYLSILLVVKIQFYLLGLFLRGTHMNVADFHFNINILLLKLKTNL